MAADTVLANRLNCHKTVTESAYISRMSSHAEQLARRLGIRRFVLLKTMPILGSLVNSDQVWEILITPPDFVSESERNAWMKNWAREWNRISNQIYLHQPREYTYPRGSEYQRELLKQWSERNELTIERLMSSPAMVEEDKKYRLPHVNIKKGGILAIRCHTQEELQLVAALGVTFSRSQLYAQKIYAQLGISNPNLEELSRSPRTKQRGANAHIGRA